MKLTELTLKQIIEEEFKRILSEGDVIQGPWEEDEEDPDFAEREELPEEYQYEYVLDELIDAARDGVMPLAIEKLKEVGGYRIPEHEASGGHGALTYNDIELEIEEPLLDALKPLAKIIQGYRDRATKEDEW